MAFFIKGQKRKYNNPKLLALVQISGLEDRVDGRVDDRFVATKLILQKSLTCCRIIWKERVWYGKLC